MSDADYEFIIPTEYADILDLRTASEQWEALNKLLNDKSHQQLYTPANGGFGSEDTSLINRDKHTHIRFSFAKEIKPEVVECDHKMTMDFHGAKIPFTHCKDISYCPKCGQKLSEVSNE